MNKDLLIEILSHREPELVKLFEDGTPKNIGSDTGNHIRSILTDEFLATGLEDPDGNNINNRGKAIEQLIDHIGNLIW
ncbi:hypothetical protein P4482_04125 [Neobacillus thermocopriae]|jgi:hypothetical protein|uniref:hypothetical protein n=1 Tax=Neobacillus thermocopriae TaxID=1215031 RepID=UPI002E22CAEC|nr:hypothetical protein [Neobacillus thermocopriae]MED3713398.1 hypothetical protein [Neobacillus thermocopriae]